MAHSVSRVFALTYQLRLDIGLFQTSLAETDRTFYYRLNKKSLFFLV